MKKIIVTALLFTTVFTTVTQAQSAAKKPAGKEALAWFKKKQWLNGLKLKPSKSVDVQEFYRQYRAHKNLWDTSFAFLKTHDLTTLANGKYMLAGDSAFVSVTEGPLKSFDSTQWESHKKYIDVQYVA